MNSGVEFKGHGFQYFLKNATYSASPELAAAEYSPFAFAPTFSDFSEFSAAGVGSRPVDRKLQHRRIVFEAALGAVAVMKVPVHHQDAAKTQAVLSIANPDGNIIIKANPFGL